MNDETDWTAVSDAAHAQWVSDEERQGTPIGPRACPITGRAFYDNMEHPDLGWIAMYGGPLDVYSIPRLDDTDNELRVERYDLDADGWVEGGEPLGYFYRDQQPDHAAKIARLRAEADALRKVIGEVTQCLADTVNEVGGWAVEEVIEAGMAAAMGADA